MRIVEFSFWDAVLSNSTILLDLTILAKSFSSPTNDRCCWLLFRALQTVQYSSRRQRDRILSGERSERSELVAAILFVAVAGPHWFMTSALSLSLSLSLSVSRSAAAAGPRSSAAHPLQHGEETADEDRSNGNGVHLTKIRLVIEVQSHRRKQRAI